MNVRILLVSLVLATGSLALAQAPKKNAGQPSRKITVKAKDTQRDPVIGAALDKARAIAAQGDELVEKGSPKEALEKYREARQITTAGGLGLRGMADALYSLGDAQGAANALRELLYPKPDQHWSTSDSTDPVMLMKFALLLSDLGETKEAMQSYNQALKYAHPTLLKPYLTDFGTGGVQPGKFEASARLVLAEYHTNMGDHDAAIGQLQHGTCWRSNFGPWGG
jgi:tetratricopeptide (TPR) repeat protein